jgi:DNA-binding response OmpR family regulator
MKILSLSTDPELSELRRHALQAAGHEVVSLITEKDALRVANSKSEFEVVLLCHSVLSGTARQLVRLLRQNNPDGKVVYIVHLYGEWPELEADRYVVGADGPTALLRIIDEVRTFS